MPAAAMSVAAIAAVSCVALMNVVVLDAPLNVTTAPAANPDPFTVNVNAAPPAAAPVGESDVMAIFELLIVNWRLAEVPPPGAALVTETVAVPAVAMSAAVIAAVSCVALTNVVALEAPLNLTTDPVTKPVPFTVRVKADPPAAALVGEIEVPIGAGLLIAKVWALEMPPPGGGFVTVTFAVPPVAISATGIVAAI
jgi:hypothetical protein